MNALISNDDGITASGILASKKAMENLCDTYVVAPETQQSGIGHALTLFEPLRVNEYTLRDGSMGYGVNGTPTDAVTIGLFEILDKKPDIMISGINTGFNIGKAELTTSGTLGAAMEAASFGIPTIAISQEVTQDDVKFENGKVEVDFDFAVKMLNKLAKIVLKKGLPEGIDLLNVNIPVNPSDDEFEVVELGNRMYSPVVEQRLDPRGKPYYWIDGEPYEFNEPGSDGYELKIKQKTTITPLKIDLTGDMSLIKEWLK
ncbi:5'-nucleotidase /3'-nucleotidase /exopolyphosphatase [Methanobrevibacter gottschalkii]|uniref:5'-nucleotidase SurE n=2 Tax=Methanobrevibacter gottschalkii TaxID=190974 RepID=A0A3N5B688_9EURY|nr:MULTISPECIES: 5'/3'-nucleotidase SurE [Methanobrevibacter]MCQ2970670.1 5'/3'-nucleotidase SurE [archaeon]OEC96570.1 5'/3'-nucleotidase SurE [Methanobrevibacter sp. A27]RPF52807.1 5'-nucleotidase /3'-nucleotidase /exopolyphosphatase [Methanobrevibacter gottschalkii DSM 11977]SEK21017.1 5'-nucleotidase /3'-nucleotidase /exopolyphosphatase [Methanobrevibacter gottschalkii]